MNNQLVKLKCSPKQVQKRSQRTRNMSSRLQECVFTPCDMVNDESELVHYALRAYIELVNVIEALNNPKWMNVMIKKLDSI